MPRLTQFEGESLLVELIGIGNLGSSSIERLIEAHDSLGDEIASLLEPLGGEVPATCHS